MNIQLYRCFWDDAYYVIALTAGFVVLQIKGWSNSYSLIYICNYLYSSSRFKWTCKVDNSHKIKIIINAYEFIQDFSEVLFCVCVRVCVIVATQNASVSCFICLFSFLFKICDSFCQDFFIFYLFLNQKSTWDGEIASK